LNLQLAQRLLELEVPKRHQQEQVLLEQVQLEILIHQQITTTRIQVLERIRIHHQEVQHQVVQIHHREALLQAVQQLLQEVRRQAEVQALREVVALLQEVALVVVLLQEAAVLQKVQKVQEALEVVEDKEFRK